MRRISAAFFFVMCALIIAGCSREKEKPGSAAKNELNIAATVLATISDDEKPPAPVPGHGAPAAQDGPASFQVTFSESGSGVAYTVEKNKKIYVVHNNTRGKEYASIGTIVLSPDGRRTAYAALADGKWRMVVEGREGGPYDTLLTPIFSPDSRHVAYQAKQGGKWYIVVDNESNEGTIASYTTPEFSSDSKSIAYVEAAASNSKMKLVVSDLTFKKRHIMKSIGDLLFVTNREKTRIAAEQVVDDKLRIIDFSFARPDVVHEGRRYDLIEQLALSDDGTSVIYCALRGRKRLIVLDGREEQFPEGRLREPPVIRPDRKAAGVLLISRNLFSLHQSFVNGEAGTKKYDEAENLTYGRDGGYAYAARKGRDWVAVVNGNEGPAFERIVSPVFSPDGKRLVYRARQDGRRFVVVADATGKIIEQHPAYEQVFQPVFTVDGKSIAYGVKDGNKLIWNVKKLGK